MRPEQVKRLFTLTFILRSAHLLIGAALFIAFVLTGRYMRFDFPDKDVIPPEFRLLMRSRHIYILFIALINLGLGIYVQGRTRVLQRALQIVGSFMLFSSGVILVYAWRSETYVTQHFSDLSRTGIYNALAGVGLHLLSGIADSRDP